MNPKVVPLHEEQLIDWRDVYGELMAARRVLDKIAVHLALVSPAVLGTKTIDERKNLTGVIKGIVAAQYNISLDKLCGRERMAVYAWPRQIAMALSREFCQLPLEILAQIFERDHGTVHHACVLVKDRCDCSSDIAADIESLRIKIRSIIAAA